MNIRPFNTANLPKIPYPPFDLPSGPLDLEIGCGNGYHSLQYSLKHQNRHLVAIEHTRTKFLKFHRRYLNHHCPSNLSPIHGNAINWVAQNLAPNTLDRIFILYPNPNPLPRHHNKRWHRMPFMHYLLSTLKKEGTLFIATNEDFYAQEVIKYMTHHWKLELKHYQKQNSLEKSQYLTYFEKKYLERGQVCHHLEFFKNF